MNNLVMLIAHNTLTLIQIRLHSSLQHRLIPIMFYRKFQPLYSEIFIYYRKSTLILTLILPPKRILHLILLYIRNIQSRHINIIINIFISVKIVQILILKLIFYIITVTVIFIHLHFILHIPI